MDLKIVYKIRCKIDVHKTFVVAGIASTNKQGITFLRVLRFFYLHEKSEKFIIIATLSDLQRHLYEIYRKILDSHF